MLIEYVLILHEFFLPILQRERSCNNSATIVLSGLLLLYISKQSEINLKTCLDFLVKRTKAITAVS